MFWFLTLSVLARVLPLFSFFNSAWPILIGIRMTDQKSGSTLEEVTGFRSNAGIRSQENK